MTRPFKRMWRFKRRSTKLAGLIFRLDQMRETYLFIDLIRAFYIAISFVQQKRFKESAALVNKSEIYMGEAKKTVNEGQKPKTSDLDYPVRKTDSSHRVHLIWDLSRLC